uniref:Putative methyltransferase n=1 Tax=viral metagenome TaxID=1070528 RepID=A0A6M3IF10_9ZZZZ
MTLKILNLYAGIGGNRKLWDGDIEVTAVELDPQIAKIYQDFFPQDKVIVTDAHQFLLEHYEEFDFIWSSPPCPTHSRIRKFTSGGRFKEVYPDMALWQEIVFLENHFNGKWVVENVIPYYELLPYQVAGRHAFWSNFVILNKDMPVEIPNTKHRQQVIEKDTYFLNIPKQYVRNAVHPKLGKHIFDCAFRTKQKLLTEVSSHSSQG